MDRWHSNTDRIGEQLFNMTYRAGLRKLFEPCRDPLPHRMAELTERIAQIDQQGENNLSLVKGHFSELWRDDNWP